MTGAPTASAGEAPSFAAAFGRSLTGTVPDPLAVLFYGSALRTGDRDGVLDFYVLTREPPRGLRGLFSRWLWPDVSYREMSDAEGVLRAKVATMTLAQFQRAAGGRGLDTTIWARFVQPAALVWSEGPQSADGVTEALASAARTAGRFAAALGPPSGPPAAYWQALFRQTYAAEFRVERSGRERDILGGDVARYDALLRQAWRGAGLAFDEHADGSVTPQLSQAARREVLSAWRLRRAMGRPLNIARLIKASFTFDGAARYAAWKIERHTGVAVPVTPWRERHPILAAPGVLWRLWRARRAARQPEAR
jgi:hypothetical protein